MHKSRIQKNFIKNCSVKILCKIIRYFTDLADFLLKIPLTAYSFLPGLKYGNVEQIRKQQSSDISRRNERNLS